MANQDVHLINPLGDHVGGSEQRTLSLYRLICKAHAGRTLIWSYGKPHPDITAQVPVNVIDQSVGSFPKDGILLFVGVYFPFGDWLSACKPSRIALIVNLLDHRSLEVNLAALGRAGHHEIRVAYTSKTLQAMMQPKGSVLYSLIDLDRFPPVNASQARFTLGRFSRDKTFKHHHEDAVIYDDVLARGGAVSLMGATALQPQPRWSPHLTHLPAGSESPAAFLRRLNCFFYRTTPGWLETFGRVIHEAMCSGLPVVCHRSVGGCEHIQHGKNGLLFNTTSEALGHLDLLRRDEALRLRMGSAARDTMLTLHGDRLPEETLAFVLR